ncbi:MAG: rRNA maturation RNase YbeY [Planctomycetota bacterium]|nr:rRNA maturation RNase YbeY [Planctomycetota bacterium]
MPTDPYCQLTITGRIAEAPSFDAERLQRVCDDALREAGHEAAALTVELVDDSRSAELHVDHFNDPEPTDVMTFPDGGVDPEIGCVHLGDLAVGIDVARRMAVERHGSEQRAGEELELYILHGLLHLLGYDDIEPDLRATMWQRQHELMARVGIDIGDA